MRAERRGRAVRACSVVNRREVGGAGERAEAEGEAVCDLQTCRLGGLREGQGQPGGRGCRWGVDRGVRGRPEREPVQALESALVGELLPAAGAGGRDTETGRAWVEDAR